MVRTAAAISRQVAAVAISPHSSRWRARFSATAAACDPYTSINSRAARSSCASRWTTATRSGSRFLDMNAATFWRFDRSELPRLDGLDQPRKGYCDLVSADPPLIRQNHRRPALTVASLAFQPAPERVELNIAPDHPRQLARIEPAGMAAPAAEEPQQPLSLHRATMKQPCRHGVTEVWNQILIRISVPGPSMTRPSSPWNNASKSWMSASRRRKSSCTSLRARWESASVGQRSARESKRSRNASLLSHACVELHAGQINA